MNCKHCGKAFKRKVGHGVHKYCSEHCCQAAGRDRNRIQLRKYSQAYYHAHKAHIIKQRKTKEETLSLTVRKERATRKAHRYNYSPDAYEHFKEQLFYQKKRCAVCGKRLRKPNFDHNHTTLQFRGAVCHGCNSGLGHLEKAGWLKKAMAYLRRWDKCSTQKKVKS